MIPQLKDTRTPDMLRVSAAAGEDECREIGVREVPEDLRDATHPSFIGFPEPVIVCGPRT